MGMGSQPFVASDPAYPKATRDIDALSHTDAAEFAKDHFDRLCYDPENRLLAYEWAYSTWRSMDSSKDPWDTRIGLEYKVLQLYELLKPPYNIELARCRFLTEADMRQNQRLLPLGKALLAKRPNDHQVTFGLFTIIIN